MTVTPSPAANPRRFDSVSLAAEIAKLFGSAVSPSSEDSATAGVFVVESRRLSLGYASSFFRKLAVLLAASLSKSATSGTSAIFS